MKFANWFSAMRRPVSARVPVRRSTALIAVLFVGLGVLWLTVRTPSTSASTARANNNLSQLVKNLPPGVVITRESTTTVTPPVTTPATTSPPTSLPAPHPSAPTETTQTVPSTTSTTGVVGHETPSTTVLPTSTTGTVAPRSPPTS